MAGGGQEVVLVRRCRSLASRKPGALLQDSPVGGAGRRLDYLHSGGAAFSAPVLAATYAIPSVAATAALITTSTAPSRAPSVAARAPAEAAAAVASTAAAAGVTAAAVTAAAVTSASAETSRAPGTSADGELAALHSCGGKDSPHVRGLGRADLPAPTLGAAPYILRHWQHDLPKGWMKVSPISEVFLLIQRDVRAHFRYCYTLKNSKPLLIIRHHKNQNKGEVRSYIISSYFSGLCSCPCLFCFSLCRTGHKMPAARFLLASLLMGPPSPSPNQPHSWALLLTDAHLALQLP